MNGEAGGRYEKAAAMPEGTGRNPEGTGCGASSMAITKGHCGQERQDWMEVMVGIGQRPVSSAGFNVAHEPPYTEPYVRWCGGTAGVTPPPTRSHAICARCVPLF